MKKTWIAGLLGLALATVATAEPNKKKKPATSNISSLNQPAAAAPMGPRGHQARMEMQLQRMDSLMNLSPEQEAQIRELNRQHAEAIQQLNKQHKMAIKALLTPEQQAVMKAQREAMQDQRESVRPAAPMESPE